MEVYQQGIFSCFASNSCTCRYKCRVTLIEQFKSGDKKRDQQNALTRQWLQTDMVDQTNRINENVLIVQLVIFFCETQTTSLSQVSIPVIYINLLQCVDRLHMPICQTYPCTRGYGV